MTLCLRGIKKQLYVYIMEYNSAIKKNEIMPFAVTWMDLKIIKRREVRERQIQDTTSTWNLKHDTNELIYKTEADSQTWKTNLQPPKEKGVAEG